MYSLGLSLIEMLNSNQAVSLATTRHLHHAKNISNHPSVQFKTGAPAFPRPQILWEPQCFSNRNLWKALNAKNLTSVEFCRRSLQSLDIFCKGRECLEQKAYRPKQLIEMELAVGSVTSPESSSYLHHPSTTSACAALGFAGFYHKTTTKLVFTQRVAFLDAKGGNMVSTAQVRRQHYQKR